MLLALWYHSILATLFALLAVLLMGVILLQRGKGVGLSGAFGGAGGHTAFGAKTGDVLTWATIVIAVVMLVFAVILNYVFVPVAPPGPGPAVAPLTIPSTPTEAPGGGTGGSTVPPDGEPAPLPTEPVPAPTETPPPTDTEKPNETTPGGGGDAPGWVAQPGILGAEPG
ncbi:MAG: preprotein translocase subunit SecG [Planctomycetes bacterium]|nr:preprotein translocase subunit SecG [Planctomycetota bacterium]